MEGKLPNVSSVGSDCFSFYCFFICFTKILIMLISPQPGPQTKFLSTSADIAIYGGAAGGGKSFALLIEPLRHLNNSLFGGVIFRRNTTQIRNQGGLWDESLKIYSLIEGSTPRQGYLDWHFQKGMQMKFSHLEYDRTVYDWQGAQIAFLGFDELTHFSSFQFFYMLSRNRSTSGVPGYVRATCNPDPKSWVREFIDWWLDKNGDPIQERSGIVRWYLRKDDTLYWADSRQELLEEYGSDELPKSVTFIPSSIQDNKILLQKDPAYLANLKSLSRVDRGRLLGGNWNITESAGSLFQREWFPVLDAVPAGWTASIRFWDRAATKPSEKNKDPDWTRGVKLLRYPDGSFVVSDLKSLRDTPGQVESLICNTASHDSNRVRIMAQQDPGSAGVAEANNFVRMLQGYDVKTMASTKDKITRAKPVSAQCEVGNVRVIRAPWNDEFFNELENFPTGSHDDIVDALSGAFNALCVGANSILDVHHLLR
jgi:predicted phage terminase large subunit-like protein